MNAKSLLFLGSKVFLGILMIIFGLNKFLNFIPVDPPADATAQTFLGTMFTSYLAPVVALFELIGGALLLVPRTAFLGSLILLPVLFNIVAFHIAHDLPGNGIWLVPTFLLAAVLVFFKDRYKFLLAN